MTSHSQFQSRARARRHTIVRERPAPGFFDGALLGNGGLGAVVTTRPDSVVIYFGHNSVWDIRVSEKHADEIGTFQEIFERVQAIPHDLRSLNDDPWFNEYCAKMADNYRQPYPRPFPCGLLLLGFDRREAELLGHRLDISSGQCEVDFWVEGKAATLQIFTEMNADRLWLRWFDASGQPGAAPFNRVRLIPDATTPAEFPRRETPDDVMEVLSFRQVLPCQTPELYNPAIGDQRDRAFRLSVCVQAKLGRRGHINTDGRQVEMAPLERSLAADGDFVACVQLEEGLASQVGAGNGEVLAPTTAGFQSAADIAQKSWSEYWACAGVALDDEVLERAWYRNLYFLNCSARDGVTCPGLFANWSYGNIGTAWHGDYHMNYNTQQPFWATFSSNHVDKHLPYVDMVDKLRPLSRKWAHEYYGLRGAYFPHSAYPTEMNIMPYPVPTWGWEICETPWTVQSLWWHYLYTQDENFLRERAFEPIKEAVLFLVDYMMRPEARGERWNDDLFHIFPTVPPELYGLRPGFDKNDDCLVDLTLTKFIFRAYLDACGVLQCMEKEAELMGQVNTILTKFPPYPTAESQRGQMWVSVPGEDPEIVQNVPNSLAPVFPGEEHGLHSAPAEYAVAVNSYRNQRNEGGNELVFLNLQAARIGQLDLGRFARQIEYCTLPNGTCADMVLQVQGRYSDTSDYAFMAPMGVWFENFGLPAVINECLLQSYTGVLRFFPNWPLERAAEFHSLRAVGAFLVGAKCADGAVQWIEIYSEAGAPLSLYNPWPQGAALPNATGVLRGEIIELQMHAGETLRFVAAE